MSRPFRIVFVCLGNICRSPMAELAMRRLLDQGGLADRVQVASAGTGDYHVGEGADPRAAATLREHGYDPDRRRLAEFRATQFTADDFAGADLVLALDASNAEVLRRRAPDAEAAAKVRLLRAFDPASVAAGEVDVPDPYYGGEDGFPHVLALVEAACQGLLEHLRTEPALAR
ncbi:MAG TPA: low molecular weight protein-tyrosine-phosphatase [Frankiaceae bacterium]|nr:low molecular weight protein-tyrosine-phosphatase [Frankiaceae bacterium]